MSFPCVLSKQPEKGTYTQADEGGCIMEPLWAFPLGTNGIRPLSQMSFAFCFRHHGFGSNWATPKSRVVAGARLRPKKNTL